MRHLPGILEYICIMNDYYETRNYVHNVRKHFLFSGTASISHMLFKEGQDAAILFENVLLAAVSMSSQLSHKKKLSLDDLKLYLI